MGKSGRRVQTPFLFCSEAITPKTSGLGSMVGTNLRRVCAGRGCFSCRFRGAPRFRPWPPFPRPRYHAGRPNLPRQASPQVCPVPHCSSADPDAVKQAALASDARHASSPPHVSDTPTIRCRQFKLWRQQIHGLVAAPACSGRCMRPSTATQPKSRIRHTQALPALGKPGTS